VIVSAPRPWLRPLEPGLHPPGTALVRTLAGHSSAVTGVAVSGDGRRAVSASVDRTLKVWDLETGLEVRTLFGHSDPVGGVAVSADGGRAVSASWDQTLKVWDLETGLEVRTLASHSGPGTACPCFAFCSPDAIAVARKPRPSATCSASRDGC